MLQNKPSLHGAQKIVVESSVDEQDENLGDAVPHSVYIYVSVIRGLAVRHLWPRGDIHLAGWWDGVCRNPDAKHCNVDASNGKGGAPFELEYGTPVFCNDGNSIDDDLHEQLDLENPEA